MELLPEDLSIQNSNFYVFITNRQKGLIDAIANMFPNSEHKYCLKHLYANYLFAGHKGLVLKHHMEAIARSTTIPWYQGEMKKLQHVSGAAFDWLAKLNPQAWCRSHFKTTSKCDILLNNMCETFNSAIVDARDKPILTCLEKIRYYSMLLMASRKATFEKLHHDIRPRIFSIVENCKKELALCIPKLVGEQTYEVKNFSGTQVVVDLRRSTCLCKQWNITGIRCKHACAAIGQLNRDHLAYVNDCYKNEAFVSAYAKMVHPMASQDLWPTCNLAPLLPPKYHNQAGRPRKKRIMSAVEPPPNL